MISVMTFSWCKQNTLNTDSTSTVNTASDVHVLRDCIGVVSVRSLRSGIKLRLGI
jgi:hypothetical protein